MNKVIDMSLNEEYIKIHNSIENIEKTIEKLDRRYNNMTDREKNNVDMLRDRLKHYLKKYEYVEIWFGIKL